MNFRSSVILLTLLLVGPCSSIIFFVEPNTEKCLRDEVHKDVLVTGDYAVLGNPAGHVISVKVMDSRQQVLHKKDNIQQQKGKFTSTVDQFDVLQVCFKSQVQRKLTIATFVKLSFFHSFHFTLDGANVQPAEISLDLKHGIETKAYEQIAEAEKLKPMEVELKKLEDLAESIVKDFMYMKAAEEEMRDTNESTHSRVLYFSLFSVFCLLGLACWQVLYLRQYFKRQKLID